MSKEIINALKQIQADSVVFYMKIHNLHWNVHGMNFRQIHEATEIIYEKFADVFDDCAERIIQLGNQPFVRLQDCINASKIKEIDTTKFSSTEVLKILFDDFKYFKEAMDKLLKIANDHNDNVTADYASDMLAYLEKELWMLKVQMS